MACSEKDSLFVSLYSIFHNFWDIIYDWNIINILGESRAFSLWNFFFSSGAWSLFFLGRVTWYQDFFFAVGASSFPTRTKRLLKVVSLYAIQKVHHTEKKDGCVDDGPHLILSDFPPDCKLKIQRVFFFLISSLLFCADKNTHLCLMSCACSWLIKNTDSLATKYCYVYSDKCKQK